MINRSPLRPSSLPIARRKAPKKKARSKAERLRIYGPPGYVEWIHATPCEICGVLPSEVVHIEGGGMGRKADFTKTVPFCRQHHALLHRIGRGTFERANSRSLAYLTGEIQSRWQSRIFGEGTVTETSKSGSGVDQERSTARTEAPASNPQQE